MSTHWGILASPPKDLVRLRLLWRARRFAKLRKRADDDYKAEWIHNLAQQGWYSRS